MDTLSNPYLADAFGVGFRQYDRNARKNHRDELVTKYAWAIPNENAISLLASMSPVLEMAAGNGYWAKLIVDAGGTVEAFDKTPGLHHPSSLTRKLWYPVKRGGVHSIQPHHKDYTLLLVWPPYDTPLAFKALTRFLEIGGKTVMYVGEGYGGCTGCDQFHALLDSRFKEVAYTEIPSWEYIHDHMMVYERLPDESL